MFHLVKNERDNEIREGKGKENLGGFTLHTNF